MVTVITAPAPLPNPGMATVDLAAFAFLRRQGLLDRACFRRLYTPEERNPLLPAELMAAFEKRQALPIEYSLLRDRTEDLKHSEAILFWGDFLHSREYIFQVALTLLDTGLAPSPEEALETAYRHLCLTDLDESVLRRCLIFGGTLIFNREREYRNRGYADPLTRLFQSAAGVWMRDVYSALRVDSLRNTPPGTSLGVDSALLLRSEDLALLPRSTRLPPDSQVGIFFGRHGTDAGILGRFCRDLCARVGAVARWLPWFDPHYLPNHQGSVSAAFPEMLPPLEEPPGLGDLLAEVRHCRAVITDTYHLCVNAWAANIPAFCIGKAWSHDGLDVSSGWRFAWRDKRQVFYAMHDAMEYYVLAEELADPDGRQARLEHAAALMQDSEGAVAVAEIAKQRARGAEERLARTLRRLTC